MKNSSRVCFWSRDPSFTPTRRQRHSPQSTHPNQPPWWIAPNEPHITYEDDDERLEWPWPGFRFFFRRLGVRGRGEASFQELEEWWDIDGRGAPFGDEGNGMGNFMGASSDGSQLWGEAGSFGIEYLRHSAINAATPSLLDAWRDDPERWEVRIVLGWKNVSVSWSKRYSIKCGRSSDDEGSMLRARMYIVQPFGGHSWPESTWEADSASTTGVTSGIGVAIATGWVLTAGWNSDDVGPGWLALQAYQHTEVKIF